MGWHNIRFPFNYLCYRKVNARFSLHKQCGEMSDSHSDNIGTQTVQDDPLARGPAEVYLQIFNEFVNQLTDDELTTGYYHQDGATCHT
jgi:hypothetical protein